jgi:MYXO-CTERM domain-containing protein
VDTAAAGSARDGGWGATVSRRLEAGRRAFRAEGAGFRATHGQAGLEIHLDDQGAVLDGPEGTLTMRFLAWGRGGALVEAEPARAELGDCTEEIDVTGDCLRRVELSRGPVIEWWASREEGLQQAWELSERPAGEGELRLVVGVTGAIPSLDDGEVVWVGHDGGLWRTASLEAWDATGRPLDARFELGAGSVEGAELHVVVDDAQATWPIFIDPITSTAASTWTGGTAGDLFGVVGGGGDINGDGYDDFVVGAPGYSSNTGVAYVFYGSAAGPAATADVTLSSPSTGAYFGAAVDIAGDVNDDGYDDVIVGAPYESTAAALAGRAYVYHGTSAGLSTTVGSTLTGSATAAGYFGNAVSSSGDVNGDGFADVIVGEYGYSSSKGRAWVYAGSSAGASSTTSQVFLGTSSGDRFGWAVSGGGDTTVDGFDDIAVGAPLTGTGDAGSARVYKGASNFFTTAPSVAHSYTSFTNGYNVGTAVNIQGDYNNDGYSDLVLGAPYGPGSGFGRVYFYRSNTTAPPAVGLPTGNSATFDGPSAASAFGSRIDWVGDSNGDGRQDLVVGGPYAVSNAGYAGLYEGVASGLAGSAKSTFFSGSGSDLLGLSVAGAGDVNNDGYDDVLLGAPGASGTKGEVRLHYGGVDADGDTYLSNGSSYQVDCDDSNSAVNPAATELCDELNVDEDCDGQADDLDSAATGESAWYADDDEDGYGDAADSITACDAPAGYVATSGDCDDTTAARSPGNMEICDGADLDEDCDGLADDADPSADGAGKSDAYVDGDADSYGSGAAVAYCDLPSGYAAQDGDCDDASADVNPGATEVCDAADLDEDCDGLSDDADSSALTASKSSFHPDADGDSYGTTASALFCDLPSGYATSTTDCDDGDAAIHPGATELCDAADTDEDCDGLADNADSSASVATKSSYYLDADGDAFGAGSAVKYCDLPSGYSLVDTDCDDGAASVNPGATELCDAANTDEDCDGQADNADSSASVATKSSYYSDGDSDGYGAGSAVKFCDLPTGYAATSTDCDDGVAAVNPGATELCDGADTDEDCDGLADNADSSASTATKSSYYLDGDGDSYGGPTTAKFCDLPAGYTVTSTDCDDAVAAIHPGATEVCDVSDTDEDCDGLADDDDSSASAGTKGDFYADGDGDGYGAGSATAYCDAPTSYVSLGEDCDDGATGVNPGATELCDATNTDEDCDGLADNADSSASAATKGSYYLDGDTDGYGTGSAVKFCDLPTGYAVADTDCDDAVTAVNPGATEVCDAANTDEDCDGLADNADTSASVATKSSYYRDSDTDGYGSTTTAKFCDLPSGYSTSSTDCDDTSTAVNPGATEVCDAADTDEDCDGTADDDDSSVSAATQSTGYLDGDSDGYGGATTALFCDLPSGYLSSGTDCDDAAAAVNPGATEVCDAGDTDEDCDGLADDADSSASAATKTRYYTDSDGDSYGTSSSADFCDLPSGYAVASGDCDDGRAAVNPGATEVCDPVNRDEDCDGTADNADSSASAITKSSYYQDGDGDGYGSATTGAFCDLPSGYTAVGADCDDGDALINPAAAEVCDPANVDEDCDGLADDADSSTLASGKVTSYRDVDGDSYGSATTALSCDLATGYVSVGGDCDDGAPATHPGATEVCDASDADEDCDGLSDDSDGSVSAATKTTYYRDTDGDGYAGATTGAFCSAPSGYYASATDCKDSDDSVHPGATELVADGVDQTCDGQELCYVDADGDGYRVEDTILSASVTCGATGLALASEPGDDCDDTDAAYNPGAVEADCTDPADYNCDGSTGYADEDSDGYAACEECDDQDAAINPAAQERCDALDVDEDCDGLIDDDDSSVDASTKTSFYADGDGDGYAGSTTADFCDLPTGFGTAATDCDDGAVGVNPGAAELCDGADVDEDCDGLADDADLSVDPASWSVSYQDGDGDGYGATAASVSCDLLPGYVAVDGDCDDAAEVVNPGAAEVCDLLDTDEDCDGLADDLDSSVDATSYSAFYADVDEDGFGDPDAVVSACDESAVAVADDSDCDDEDALVNPDAIEIVGDGIDQDCDLGELCYVDADGDGWRTDAEVASSTLDCSGVGEGLASDPTDDCNDADPAFHPGATEDDCSDPSDYNCDGSVGYADADGDGYAACEECDDGAVGVNPDATEVCDGVDNDCDTVADGADAMDALTWYGDLDADGYTNPDDSAVACDAPDGYAAASAEADCDDLDEGVNPAALEGVDDALDQDCDGLELCYVDADDDGFRPDETSTAESADLLCDGAGEATAEDAAGDCDDDNPDAYPGAEEVAGDAVDQDCDGADLPGDTGPEDTGPTDGDTGGSADGGDGGDGGFTGGGKGCGCSAGAGASAGWLGLLLGVAALGARRRRVA